MEKMYLFQWKEQILFNLVKLLSILKDINFQLMNLKSHWVGLEINCS